MSQSLRQTIANGDYEVDPSAVAVAMLDQARALRAARRGATSRSEVLVPADGIEIRRLGAREVDLSPLEGAA
jgi:hypothetical protein